MWNGTVRDPKRMSGNPSSDQWPKPLWCHTHIQSALSLQCTLVKLQLPASSCCGFQSFYKEPWKATLLTPVLGALSYPLWEVDVQTLQLHHCESGTNSTPFPKFSLGIHFQLPTVIAGLVTHPLLVTSVSWLTSSLLCFFLYLLN